MPSDESKGSQLDAIGSLAQRQLDNTFAPSRRTGTDRAVKHRKRDRPRGPESRPGLPRRSRLARSGPGTARAWIQVSARERGIPLLDGVSLRVRGTLIADIASDTPQIWVLAMGR